MSLSSSAKPWIFPDLGPTSDAVSLKDIGQTSDGRFKAGSNGVQAVASTGDGKVEFIGLEDTTLAHVTSSLGYPAYYPVPAVGEPKPIKAVLMDLDGTTVHSEEFWIWIIQTTISKLMQEPSFELSEEDIPFVSGHSVSEHLGYCIEKYCPDRLLEDARKIYFDTTDEEMQAILDGHGRPGAFQPAPGIKEFLQALKNRGIRIALVTSGLYVKAYPEIISAFEAIGLGDPEEFYDSIITAGTAVGRGKAGTMGELSPKPHPWLYSESLCVGLGMSIEERHTVIGIEDSGAGVCALRLAGVRTFGLAHGNIRDSGTEGMCHAVVESFDEILAYIDDLGTDV